jgi:broad specificity phosphatase PhoE
MTCTLILIRHGEIKANRQRRWHGSTDSPLLWRGRRQARRLGRFVSATYPSIDAIYSSPLQRCINTAWPLAERLELKIQPHADLREWSLGDWEDRLFRELADDEDFFNKSLRDPDYLPPGGESLAVVSERYVRALREINANHTRSDADSRVAVFGHGAAIQVALSQFIDGTPKRWQSYSIANCSITELVLTPEPYVEGYNLVHYL